MTLPVRHHVIDGFHFLVLDERESRNALSPQMVQALERELDAASADAAARAIVLRGADGMFSAGGNVGSFAQRLASESADADPIAARNRAFGAFLEKLTHIDLPTVALVEGAAIGGGLGLACCCDFVIAQESAKFALSETTLGLIPAQIAPFLVKRLGAAQTLRLALSGKRFDGREALALGVVDIVLESSTSPDDALAELLSQIGRCAPGANRQFKQLMCDEALAQPRSQLLDNAAAGFAQCMRGEGREGIAALREKRAAAWAVNVTGAAIAALQEK